MSISEEGNGTVSSNGPRYIVSPSLPSGAQKYVASFRCRELVDDVEMNKKGTTSLPKLQSTYLSSCLGSSKNQSMGISLDDPSFSDTLSKIGPSARRLLELDEKRKSAQQMVSTLNGSFGGKRRGQKTRVRRYRAASEKSGSVSLPLPEGDDKLFSDTLASGSGRGAGSHKETSPERFMASLTGTLNRKSRNETNKILKDLPQFKATITRNPNEEPPLVKTLNDYLDRELRLSCGSCVPTSAQALGPYREAFSALITAFPGYSKLLCDIQSAYDNVIQSQSELLADAYNKEMTNHQIAQKYQEDTTHLRGLVSKLEADLASMEIEMIEREQKAAKAAEQRHSAGSSRADNIELRKHLEVATLRVEELENMTKGDSEKILVLIGAVRECDKRLKAYEKKVAYMSGQVAELNEFQRLAGEAQAELQKYKHKFRAYVSAEDYELMKNHLTLELSAAQTLARHLRRTATVRGTQVDVMLRKIRQLENEQKALTESDNPKGLLTPRPQWKKVYETVPDLHEFAKPIHNDPLGQLSNNNKPHNEEEVDEAELLVVDGPTQTSLHVDFLVSLVQSLKQRLEQAENEKNIAIDTARQDHLTKSFRRVSTAEPTGSGGAVHPSAVGRQGANKSGGSSNKRRSQVETITPVIVDVPPIIAPGVKATVPIHLRCTGIVDRKPVPNVEALKLTFDFFRNELLPTLELQEPQAAAECDVQLMFLRFLEQRITQKEELANFLSAPHVALNILEDAKDPLLRTPALVLLSNILQNIMPVRLAVDATIVVSQVVDDLTAIAKEQQKSRLRRHAIAECLTPILELKTNDELAELRSALGHEASFDLYALVSIENRFLCTFFYQQCQVSMDMYAKLLKSLTAHSLETPDDNYDRLITLEDLEKAIYETEPNTPEVVVRELTENSTRRPEDASGVFEDKLRLSEVISVLDVSPIFLRTAQSSKEECVL